MLEVEIAGGQLGLTRSFSSFRRVLPFIVQYFGVGGCRICTVVAQGVERGRGCGEVFDWSARFLGGQCIHVIRGDYGRYHFLVALSFSKFAYYT